MAREYGEPRGSAYGSEDNRDRWRDEDRERSRWSGAQGTSERDDERGFFERAGEEIRSWFSDDDDRSGRDDDRNRMSGGRSSWDRDNDRSSRSQGGISPSSNGASGSSEMNTNPCTTSTRTGDSGPTSG